MADNFEPYIDWDEITPQMVDELHDCLIRYKRCQDNFAAVKHKQTCIALLKMHEELATITTAIRHSLYTVPVMVHVAGAKSSGHDDDGNEQTLQRCKRCGSVLMVWNESYRLPTPSGGAVGVPEEELDWWDENDIVAKATGNVAMTMYEIAPGRKLEDYEMLCPDLADLVKEDPSVGPS